MPKLKLPKLPALKFDFSKMIRSRTGAGNLLGLDIGTTSVKIIQLTKSAEGFKLARWAHIPLDVKTNEPTLEDQRRSAVTSLKLYLAGQKGINKNAALSVAGGSVIVRFVTFPSMPLQELAKIIEFESESYIPFAIQDVFLDFYVLGNITEEGQRKIETVLVAAKKDYVTGKVGIVTSGGLSPKVVDVDAFAIEYAFNMSNQVQQAGQAVFIAHGGASVTNLVIIENGQSRVVRDVLIGGNTFNKMLQRQFQYSYDAAESAKSKLQLFSNSEGKSEPEDDQTKQARMVINPVLKDWIGEVQRLSDFYLSQKPDRQISKVLLSGGLAGFQGLDKVLSKELHLPVEIFDPFSKISGAEAIPVSLRPQFSVAVGLALRGVVPGVAPKEVK